MGTLHCPINGSSGCLECTYTRLSSYVPRCLSGACVEPFPSSFSRDGALVLLRILLFFGFPLKGTDVESDPSMDPLGFEPRASSLQRRCSAAELWAHPQLGARYLSALIVRRCPIGRSSVGELGFVYHRMNGEPGTSAWSRSLGGDPAADSPTATLLRLKPPCEAQIRHSLRVPHPDLTRVL